MSAESSDVVAAVVDLCAQVEAQMGGLRHDYQHSIYEICIGLQNRIAKEMDRMVYHVRRLIDQNAFLHDRVVVLEQRDDPEKVSRRNRVLHNPEKRAQFVHARSSEVVDEVRRGDGRRRIHGAYRQAG